MKSFEKNSSYHLEGKLATVIKVTKCYVTVENSRYLKRYADNGAEYIIDHNGNTIYADDCVQVAPNCNAPRLEPTDEDIQDKLVVRLLNDKLNYANADRKCDCSRCELSTLCRYKNKHQRLGKECHGLGTCFKLKERVFTLYNLVQSNLEEYQAIVQNRWKKFCRSKLEATQDAIEELQDYENQYHDEMSENLQDYSEYSNAMESLQSNVAELFGDALDVLGEYNQAYADYIATLEDGENVERCVENAIYCLEHECIPKEVV